MPLTNAEKTGRIYPNLISGIITVLKNVFEDGYYADKVIDRVLKSNPKWGAKDRRFIAEVSYEIIRYRRLLFASVGIESNVAVNWVAVVQAYLIITGWEEKEIVKLGPIDLDAVRRNYSHALKYRAIAESVPDWLDAMMYESLGKQWEEEIKAMNKKSPVYLRANTIKVTPDKLYEILRAEGVEITSVKNRPDTFKLANNKNLYLTTAFKNGYFEIQDIASQEVAPALDVKPGMRVVDACAGGGGKSLHLAVLMQNKGRILALDTDARKLEKLKVRSRRNGIDIIETRVIDSAKVIKRLEGSVDRLLLDVPCSGTGVFRRNPDARWKLSPDSIENLIITQREILQKYTAILTDGGKFVYSTCSIYPEENQKQIELFLTKNLNFRLIEEKFFTPAKNDTDGFYIAVLQKI